MNSCVEMMRLILTGITKMERWVFKSDLRMISPQEMRFRQRKRRLRKLWKNEIWCSNLFCDKQFLKYIFPQNIHYFVDGKNIYTVHCSAFRLDLRLLKWGVRRVCWTWTPLFLNSSDSLGWRGKQRLLRQVPIFRFEIELCYARLEGIMLGQTSHHTVPEQHW